MLIPLDAINPRRAIIMQAIGWAIVAALGFFEIGAAWSEQFTLIGATGAVLMAFIATAPNIQPRELVMYVIAMIPVSWMALRDVVYQQSMYPGAMTDFYIAFALITAIGLVQVFITIPVAIKEGAR